MEEGGGLEEGGREDEGDGVGCVVVEEGSFLFPVGLLMDVCFAEGGGCGVERG